MKIALPSWRPWPQARVGGLRHFGHVLTLAMSGLSLLYAEFGQAKALASWHLIDVFSEALGVVMLAVWLLQVRASRPEGHVTTLLSLGLASLLLGAWCDWMDEFWKVPHTQVSLWGLESGLNLLGMGLLTWGLHQWRGEQLALTAQQQRRERLFREHRQLDPLTHLADARYMQTQLQREHSQPQPGLLLMLAWPGLETVQRQQGLAPAERLQQEAAQLLLLHLPPDALLCRYAAQHLLVLLPGREPASACATADLLQTALSTWVRSRAPGAGPVWSAQVALPSPLAPQALMLDLLQSLQPVAPGPGPGPAPAPFREPT